ncbi:IS30 family transposase, partial [Caballeronia sp. LZ034LL]|uniref:IS30 family transposase n=1 Tax=Caballeronia sp. LZ034LL TaxID=3038567 RepID=UPI0028549968
SGIARTLQRDVGSMHRVIAGNGGITPAQRTRAARTLSLAEREDISRALGQKQSYGSIAVQLGRSKSTISREVNRNGGPQKYRAHAADEMAWKRARRPKQSVFKSNAALCVQVARGLSLQWSPAQIAGWLRRQYPLRKEMHISHETIYRSLFIQTRGVLKKELLSELRTHRVMRRAKCASTRGQNRGTIINAVPISERPAQAEDRAVPGHWEGDLLAGSGNTYIATLVERHSRYALLVKVAGKDTSSVIEALIKQVNKLPVELKRSLTWDRGTEMAGHARFTIATDLKVYFCDPQSPWQRGSNENTNGLLRQYFPKGQPVDQYSQAQLNAVAKRLNQRPRQTLG